MSKRKASPVIEKESTNTQWCFTLNNYSKNDIALVKAISLNEKNKVKYLIFGKETGDSGTPHLQGFVQFSGRKKFSTVKNLFPRTTHLEPKSPNSTPQQAADYCRKEDPEPWEHGTLDSTPPRDGQGKRNDLLEAKHAMEAGMSHIDLMKADEHAAAGFKFGRQFEKYEAEITEPRNFKSFTFVFWGDSGTYKSHASEAFAKSYKVIRPRHKADGAWFHN